MPHNPKMLNYTQGNSLPCGMGQVLSPLPHEETGVICVKLGKLD